MPLSPGSLCKMIPFLCRGPKLSCTAASRGPKPSDFYRTNYLQAAPKNFALSPPPAKTWETRIIQWHQAEADHPRLARALETGSLKSREFAKLSFGSNPCYGARMVVGKTNISSGFWAPLFRRSRDLPHSSKGKFIGATALSIPSGCLRT